MKVIRKVANITLSEYVSDENKYYSITLSETNQKPYSRVFNHDVKTYLSGLDDNDFITESYKLLYK